MSNYPQIAEIEKSPCENLICFSHLRWDFVYQRPQHLMARLTKKFRVFFIEEPIFDQRRDCFSTRYTEEGVWVVTPSLKGPHGTGQDVLSRQKNLLKQYMLKKKIDRYFTWYYTPMALKLTCNLEPEMVIYDCMDELSAFKFAPAELKLLEAELFKQADLAFTGGYSLYEAKKHCHHNIYPFPSSIDKDHFLRARKKLPIPADQEMAGLRIGFYGVIDERFDIRLISEVAARRPAWQFILVGPVVKIDPATLPRNNNIHYLGNKSYKELPAYISGWDIAMIPFEKNDSTRFISPTKTPEYLAAGKPVISSSITDVVSPYGKLGLVHIADSADEFICCVERELTAVPAQKKAWAKKVDTFLKNISWDFTAARMIAKIDATIAEKTLAKKGASKLKSVA